MRLDWWGVWAWEREKVRLVGEGVRRSQNTHRATMEKTGPNSSPG